MNQPGYVDPTLGAPVGVKERQLFTAIRARGLSLHRLHADRQAVRLTGPGVYVIAASLSALTMADLEPKNDQ